MLPELPKKESLFIYTEHLIAFCLFSTWLIPAEVSTVSDFPFWMEFICKQQENLALLEAGDKECSIGIRWEGILHTPHF